MFRLNAQKTACAVLYFQDGSDYIKRAKAIQTQQNLVKDNKVKPFIMVFIDPKDRTKEYWASDEYAKFLATEIVPAIDAKYNTIKNRATDEQFWARVSAASRAFGSD